MSRVVFVSGTSKTYNRSAPLECMVEEVSIDEQLVVPCVLSVYNCYL